jgi:hypothetical protein
MMKTKCSVEQVYHVILQTFVERGIHFVHNQEQGRFWRGRKKEKPEVRLIDYTTLLSKLDAMEQFETSTTLFEIEGVLSVPVTNPANIFRRKLRSCK